MDDQGELFAMYEKIKKEFTESVVSAAAAAVGGEQRRHPGQLPGSSVGRRTGSLTGWLVVGQLLAAHGQDSLAPTVHPSTQQENC